MSYASQIIIQLLGIASGIVIARVAGPSVMGKLTFGLAYAHMFGFLVQMGLGTAHIKLVSEGQPLDRCLGTYTRMIAVTTSLYVVATLTFFFIQKYGYKVNFEGFDTEFCIYAAIVASVFSSASSVVQTTFAAKIQQARQDVPNIAVNFVSALAKIVIVLLGFRVIALAGWSVVHALLILAIAAYLFRNQRIGKYDKELALKYITISAPLLMVVAVNSLIHNVDKVLLKFFVSAEEVGYYGAGYRIGGFIQIIAANIGAMFFPLFSGYLAKGQKQELLHKINQYQRASLLYIFPFVLFVMIFAPLIVRILLGSQYQPSAIPMSIITLALFIYTVYVPFGNILVASGKYGRYAFIQIAILAAYLVMLVGFTHPKLLNLKSTGTSLALLGMYILSYVLYRQQAGRLIEIRTDRGMVRMILYMAAVFACFALLYTRTALPVAGDFGLGLLYFVFLYGGLWLLKLANPSDLAFLKQALHPGQMKKYIASEFGGEKTESSDELN